METTKGEGGMTTKTYPLSILDDEPIITNASLRAQDQERIAALEGLLRDVYEEYKREANLFTTIKRIEAALGKEG